MNVAIICAMRDVERDAVGKGKQRQRAQKRSKQRKMLESVKRGLFKEQNSYIVVLGTKMSHPTSGAKQPHLISLGMGHPRPYHINNQSSIGCIEYPSYCCFCCCLFIFFRVSTRTSMELYWQRKTLLNNFSEADFNCFGKCAR